MLKQRFPGLYKTNAQGGADSIGSALGIAATRRGQKGCSREKETRKGGDTSLSLYNDSIY